MYDGDEDDSVELEVWKKGGWIAAKGFFGTLFMEREGGDGDKWGEEIKFFKFFKFFWGVFPIFYFELPR